MTKDYKSLLSGAEILGRAIKTGDAPVVLTPEIAERIGFAFAMWLSKVQNTPPDQLTIAVGRDPRLSGESLMQRLIHGLTIADCDVFDCGLCTTPAMYLSTISPEIGADGAVMVTAGKHPPHMNGFTLISRKGALSSADIEEILVSAQEVTLPQRLVTGLDCLLQYRAYLSDMVRHELGTDVQCPLLGLHVIVDAGSGSGGFYADLLEELGAEVTGSRLLTPDGRFSGHAPDPDDKNIIEDLGRIVVDNTADIGVLFDADCKRAAIVDETGAPINRNRLIALLAAILLEDITGATFVTDSVTSSGLQRFITEWGGAHYRFKRGYANVIHEAIRLNAEGIDCPLAVETSGHAAFRDNHFLDDGMYLVTRILCEALRLKREGRTLRELTAELKDPVERVELRLRLKSPDYKKAAQGIIEIILSHTLENPAWRLAADNREGVRIIFDLDGGVDNAWFMMRLSLHDPVMAVNAESDVPGGVKTMLGALYALLQSASDLLDLEPLTRV